MISEIISAVVAFTLGSFLAHLTFTRTWRYSLRFHATSGWRTLFLCRSRADAELVQAILTKIVVASTVEGP